MTTEDLKRNTNLEYFVECIGLAATWEQWLQV